MDQKQKKVEKTSKIVFVFHLKKRKYYIQSMAFNAVHFKFQNNFLRLVVPFIRSSVPTSKTFIILFIIIFHNYLAMGTLFMNINIYNKTDDTLFIKPIYISIHCIHITVVARMRMATVVAPFCDDKKSIFHNAVHPPHPVHTHTRIYTIFCSLNFYLF